MSVADEAYDLIPASIPLPRLYATESTPTKDKLVMIKLFTPDSSWTWYLVEYDPVDDLAFGYADDGGYGAEWGYIALAELRTIRGRLGLKVERDLWFHPQTFAEAMGDESHEKDPEPEPVAPEPPAAPPPIIPTAPRWIEHQMLGSIRTVSKNAWSADLTAYAMSGSDLLAVSMVGAGTALDAIRAHVTMYKPLTIVLQGSNDGAAQYQVTTKDNRYTLFKARLPMLRRDHYILLNNMLLQPQLDEERVYVMGRHDERESDIIGRGLRQYVPVPVLPQWYNWLVAENQKLTGWNSPVRKVVGQGFRIYSIPLKACNWAELVKMGLETKAISFRDAYGTR